ncbi:MAG: hypothetical protein EP297_11250 [Gammaproteobacteria bacterium]|nr:MAG: hypothetical protein EP297_11250 [Gammaproteobacteria bacterium]
MKEDTSKNSDTLVRSGITNFLPGLRILSGYQKKDFGPDVLSGLVICLVLIPAALAYAELAGFGPIAGIYLQRYCCNTGLFSLHLLPPHECWPRRGRRTTGGGGHTASHWRRPSQGRDRGYLAGDIHWSHPDHSRQIQVGRGGELLVNAGAAGVPERRGPGHYHQPVGQTVRCQSGAGRASATRD